MKKAFKLKDHIMEFATVILSLILVAFGILDSLKKVDLYPLNGAAAFIAAMVVLFFLASYTERIKPSRTLSFFKKALLITAVLELSVFQLPSYHLLFGDYTPAKLNISDAVIYGEGGVYNPDDGSIKITGNEEVSLDFGDIGRTVGTVKINMKFYGDSKCTSLKIDMADETHETKREGIGSAKLITRNQDSRYVACHFSGEVSKLDFRFKNNGASDKVVITGIEINRIIPFDISYVRVILILLLSTLADAICNSHTLSEAYSKHRKITFAWAACITAVSIGLLCGIFSVKLNGESLTKQFKQTSGNQITEEIVEAFENRQVTLPGGPSPELEAMENPYDYGERSKGVSAKWDHLYYNGSYYSYYGVAPVLTLFLPYHLITGYYFSTPLAILIFSAVGVLFLTLSYMTILKRWFNKLPLGLVVSGLITLISACGIWFSLSRPKFYEISISCGFMYTMLGAYCLISSNLLSQGKISLPRTLLSSLFFGLAVLSRPTLAVYAACAALAYIFGIKRSADSVNKAGEKLHSIKRRIYYLLCAGLPIGALGIFQMWYNFVRFGSPFDFGIEYSLTINDFTHAQYHVVFMLIGLFQYLIAFPGFQFDYPFIKTPVSKLGANGYYFIDNGSMSGILFSALPVFGYLFAGKALSKLPTRRDKIKYAVTVGLPCVVMPLVIICSVWESGYAVRYFADFSAEIIIGGLVILFFLYMNSRNKTKRDLFVKFMAAAAVIAIIVNGVQIYNFAFNEVINPNLSYALEQIIAFWR